MVKKLKGYRPAEQPQHRNLASPSSTEDLAVFMRHFAMHHDGRPPCCPDHLMVWVMTFARDMAELEMMEMATQHRSAS